MHSVCALKQINICTLPPFKNNKKTCVTCVWNNHEKNAFFIVVMWMQAKCMQIFFLRISAPHVKFTMSAAINTKHKWAYTACHLDCIMIGDKLFNKSFTSSACCLNEYLTCNGSSVLTNVTSFYSDWFFE